ncbi:unnamed protein product, partial [marine sediment metagenome]
MANISTYPLATPTTADLIPGTQKYTDGTGKQYNLTKNFTVQSIVALANGGAGLGTVQSITFNAPLTGGTITTTGTVGINQANSTTDGFLSAADWNIFNNKQDAITVTTTGTSGPATLVAGTLNIPQYAGGGGGSVVSVGLSMPSAFTVTNSPVTGSNTLTVAGNGTNAQYIDGTGALQTFPTIPSTYNWVSIADAGANPTVTVTSGTNFSFLGGSGITTSQAGSSTTPPSNAITFDVDYAGTDNVVATAPAFAAGQAVELSDEVMIGNTNSGAEAANRTTVKEVLELVTSNSAVPEVYFSIDGSVSTSAFTNAGNTNNTEFNSFGTMSVNVTSAGVYRVTWINNMGTNYIINWTIESPAIGTPSTGMALGDISAKST